MQEFMNKHPVVNASLSHVAQNSHVHVNGLTMSPTSGPPNKQMRQSLAAVDSSDSLEDLIVCPYFGFT